MAKNILVYDVPEDLRRRFKAVCAVKGVSMSTALRNYIRAMSAETVVGSGVIITPDGEQLGIGESKG